MINNGKSDHGGLSLLARNKNNDIVNEISICFFRWPRIVIRSIFNIVKDSFF